MQRRKGGAKAPQYTRQQMEQAAMKGRVPAPPAGGANIASAPAPGSARGGNKVTSLREMVAKNAADYLLDGKK